MKKFSTAIREDRGVFFIPQILHLFSSGCSYIEETSNIKTIYTMITAHDIFSAFSSNWMTSAQVQRYIDVPVPYGHCFLTLISDNTIMFSCEREFDLDLKHLYLTYVDDRYVVSSDTSDDEYLDDFDGYADIPANILYSFRKFCSDYDLTEK